MNTKIIIAMHKPYATPAEAVYLPLHVGAQGKEPFQIRRGVSDNLIDIQRDDTGDNISGKNPYYCELTGLYWAWKNLDVDAVGLVHYRRHFTMAKRVNKKASPEIMMNSVLTTAQAEHLMEDCDVVVPNKRKYYIETLYSHYSHTLNGAHLDATRDIIAEKYPEYLEYCDNVYRQTWGYMFNMCIMRREYLDAYCTWLFDILGELENRVEVGDSAFEARLYGRVSEILFNVWLAYALENGFKLSGQKNETPNVIEVQTLHMEPVDWFKKGMAFLKAKFFGKKYTKSF